MLAPGDRVRVRLDWPETRGPCHIRTPHYLRGETGTVLRHLGDFPNPEDLAFARPAPVLPLYHVRFEQAALFGEATGGDEVVVEIFGALAGGGVVSDILETDSVRLLAALRAVLSAKGIASTPEIVARVTATDAASPERGARMVAKAWTDPAFRAAMLADGSAAAESLDIPMRGLPPLGVLEDTAELHHLVVCTLCSCYPRAVLGYPPFWFKSAAYRARAVRDPRGLLAEWGTVLPAATRLRVVDSTADYRWMVLPLRPVGTEGWAEDRLAALVREGDMIGVTLPVVA